MTITVTWGASDLDTSEAAAIARDAADPLAHFREHFFVPPGVTYLDGNSLGLLCREAEEETLRALQQWKELAIDGWLAADPPWFTLGEELGALTAPLLGAEPESVVVTGSTTVNQHALLATFYRPYGSCRKIVATELDFPSDIYAIQSQLALHGGDLADDLVRVPSRDGRTIDEDDIIAVVGGAAEGDVAVGPIDPEGAGQVVGARGEDDGAVGGEARDGRLELRDRRHIHHRPARRR